MRTLAEAIDLVLPFVSDDQARPHLCKPARWPEHVVATDGHTMAVIRYMDASPSARTLARTISKDTPNDPAPPPFEFVIPSAPRFAGWWVHAHTPQVDFIPNAWDGWVEITRDKTTLQAAVPARTGKHGKLLRQGYVMVRDLELRGFDEMDVPEPVGINASYLTRARDFIEHPHHVALYIQAPREPIVFTLSHDPSAVKSSKDLLALDRFAIVMPRVI